MKKTRFLFCVLSMAFLLVGCKEEKTSRKTEQSSNKIEQSSVTKEENTAKTKKFKEFAAMGKKQKTTTKSSKKKAVETRYYWAIRYNGTYYTETTGKTMIEPGQMIGSIQSTVDDGGKPKQDWEANWSGAVGAEVYLSDLDTEAVYVKFSEWFNGGRKTIYYRYEEGLVKLSDFPDGSLPTGVTYQGKYYTVLDEVEKIPADVKDLGMIKQAGNYFVEEELGGYPNDLLGAEVYLGKENGTDILYLRRAKERRMEGENSYKLAANYN